MKEILIKIDNNINKYQKFNKHAKKEACEYECIIYQFLINPKSEFFFFFYLYFNFDASNSSIKVIYLPIFVGCRQKKLIKANLNNDKHKTCISI